MFSNSGTWTTEPKLEHKYCRRPGKIKGKEKLDNRYRTDHGVTLGPETIQDVQHPHVEGLNCFRLENR